MPRKNPSERKRGRSSYSFINVLTGSDLSSRRLALMHIKGKQDGPVVWLTGAVHGDEVGGMVIIQEIFKELRKSPLIKGTLYAMPLMNPIGFESGTRGVPLSEEDLNRSFPGDEHGSIAERMASTIFQTIMRTKPSLVLDLHNDWQASIPYTLIDPYPGGAHKESYEMVKKLSMRAGFPVINEKESPEDTDELKKTLSGSMLLQNIPSFTFELGGAYSVHEKHIELGIQAIWNVLEELEMVLPRTAKEHLNIPQSFKNKILRYSHEPRADSSGIIRFAVKPGEVVTKGQKVANIYNVFGKLQSTLTAPKDGLVLGHADSAVAFPGAEVLAFGTT